MEEFKPAERIAVITKELIDNPYKVFSLGKFVEEFGVAKSTLSEDIATIKSVFAKMNLGKVETITGAAGGIRYLPVISREEESNILNGLVDKLKDKNRILPGDFLYMTDIIFTADLAWKVGKIFASRFIDLSPDYIVTVETKGIPIALMTARAFNIPLITIRRDNRVTEGSVVSINYITGSSRKIQTMSLSLKAISRESRVVIIDDFMKAGGTARGMLDLMKEFGVEVVGFGVLIETSKPEEKLIDDYIALLTLEKVDKKTGDVIIIPNI